jgi:hypothetical protein
LCVFLGAYAYATARKIVPCFWKDNGLTQAAGRIKSILATVQWQNRIPYIGR